MIVDDREPEVLINKLKARGIQVEIQRLQVGDYLLGNFVIERKRIEDFYNSILDGRLFRQLYQIQNSYPDAVPLLILTGKIPPRKKWTVIGDRKIQVYLEDEERKRHLKTILSAISTCLVSYKRVNFVNLHSLEQIVDFLVELSHRLTSKTPSVRPLPRTKTQDLNLAKIRMLEMIPGIGPKQADLLASNFTIRQLSLLTPEELEGKFKGIGRKKAETICKVFQI